MCSAVAVHGARCMLLRAVHYAPAGEPKASRARVESGTSLVVSIFLLPSARGTKARGFAPRPRKLPRHGSDLGEAGEKQTGQDRQTDQGLRVQGGYDTSPTAVTPRAVVSGVTRPNKKTRDLRRWHRTFGRMHSAPTDPLPRVSASHLSLLFGGRALGARARLLALLHSSEDFFAHVLF